MEAEQSSLVNQLTDLNEQYTEGYCNSISKELAEQAFRDLLTPFRTLYFSGHIIQYFELISRIASRILDQSKFLISNLEESLNSSMNIEDKLFYLDLILQLKTRLRISSRLSTETESYIFSAVSPESVERIIVLLPNKRCRKGELLCRNFDSIHLSLVEFLICFSIKIVDYYSETDIQIYLEDLKTILEFIQIINSDVTDKTKKLYVKYISCIYLILQKYPVNSISNLYGSYLFRKIDTKIMNNNQDPEVLYAWVKLLYTSILIENSDSRLKLLTDSILIQVASGSSSVKSTFLEMFDHFSLDHFKLFLGILPKSHNRDMKFIGDVCSKGVMKFNKLSNTEIIQILETYPALLDLSHYDMLPDYCFELLILRYKRSLDHQGINSLAAIVNQKLSIDLQLMNSNSLCRAGDYLALVPNHSEIKELAKVFIERMLQPEIYESDFDTDTLYRLYVVLFAIAYIPDDPNNIEYAKSELEALDDKIVFLWRNYIRKGKTDLQEFGFSLSFITNKAIANLEPIQYGDDQDFIPCKMLLRNFSRLLQEIITKLATTSPKIYQTHYSEDENDVLMQQYNQFRSDFSIETEIITDDMFHDEAQAPSSPISSESRFIPTNQPFTPQSVLRILITGLLWNGIIGILYHVTTFSSTTTQQAEKDSILEQLHEWSSYLISIAGSNLFRYLTSDISEPSKAYIIHQIFLCISDENVTFSKLMSNSIRICLFQPIKATEYDSTLHYPLDCNMIEIIKNLVNPGSNNYNVESLPDRVFYAPLDSSSDGETIIGGYIFLNSKYISMQAVYRASAKISLVHELGHLLLRLTDSKYNFMKETPEKRLKIQAPTSNIPTTDNGHEIGDFVETKVFGFTVYHINDSAIKFLNNSDVWILSLDEFKSRFRKCIESKQEEKQPLKRFRHHDQYQRTRTKHCVIRPRNYYIEEKKGSP